MIRLWCLHGNLQGPAVWADLAATLEPYGIQIMPENILKTQTTSFWEWAEGFCSRVGTIPGSHLLLGYSLGGRLALHALLTNPALWAGAIVVGADPGLPSREARAQRLQWDLAWAERIRSEPLETVLYDWDAQGVFGGRANSVSRAGLKPLRDDLARLFDLFSKGRQDDLLPRLRELWTPPLRYVAGADDAKYAALGWRLAALCPALTLEIVPEAAHRVPWENPEAFAALVWRFTQEVSP